MCSIIGSEEILQVSRQGRQGDGVEPGLLPDLGVVGEEGGGVPEVREPLFLVVHPGNQVPHRAAGLADGVVDRGVPVAGMGGVGGIIGREAGFGPGAPGPPAEGAPEDRGGGGAGGSPVPLEDGVQVVREGHHGSAPGLRIRVGIIEDRGRSSGMKMWGAGSPIRGFERGERPISLCQRCFLHYYGERNG